MIKHLPLLLFIGLAWGQNLKFINTDGQSVTILNSDLLYLNGTKYFLKDVNFKTKVVKVKKVYRTSIGQMINYNKYVEIPFDSIRSFRYLKQQFNIIPTLIGGGLGFYFLVNPEADTLSLYLGTIPAVSLGILLSFIPQFNEELFLNDNGWSIVND